jgi:Neuraminidase (sialidase)
MPNSGAPRLTGDTYGTRQGAAPVIHSYPVDYNTTGVSSAILVDTIKASTDAPVQVEVTCQIVTTFNAGTLAAHNALTAGTSTTATEWLTTANTTATTAGYYPASNAVYKQRLTADTPIYVKYVQTSTAATTGKAVVLVKEFPENATAIA